MSPTCSNRDLAGRNALSATDLTNLLSSGAFPHAGARPRTPQNGAPERLCDERAVRHPQPFRPSIPKKSPELPIRSRNGEGRVRAILAAPLEESAWTARPQRVRVRLGIGLVVALSAVGISACGGGERQDANEPSGNFPVQIVSADFPSKQDLARNTNLTLSVANTGDKTIPDLAITIFTTSNASTGQPSSGGATNGSSTTSTGPGESGAASSEPTSQGSFSVRSEQPGLAIPFRPVWILEQGFPKLAGQTASAGAEAAQTDTYSFGSLAPNQTREMVWNVTPVQPGTFTVHYRVAAGLQGKAKAVTADGSVPEGEFVVRISSTPPQTRVNDSGQVVPIKPGDIIGQAGNQKQKSELNGQ
jgi:hypothetical protein